MPLRKGSQHYPTNQREWDQWARDVPVTPDADSVGSTELKDNEVTFGKLQQLPPATVIGNQQAAQANAGAITAGADNRILISRLGQLVFDVLADGDIPDTLARDSEVAAAIAAAIVALKAEADPFPVYQTQTEGDARYVQLANVLNGSATYDPPSLADAAGTTTTVTVTGAALGDFALASFSLDLQGISVTAYVSTANTVSVRFQNESGGTLDLASGTLRARVWKQ